MNHLVMNYFKFYCSFFQVEYVINGLIIDVNCKCPITHDFPCKFPIHEFSDIEISPMSGISYTCMSYRTLTIEVCSAAFSNFCSEFFF